jgi:DedD protein
MAAQRNTNVVPEEELQLRKRARRRLVGAIALVLLAVIVLPLVLDHRPRQQPRNVQVDMPAATPSQSSVPAPASGPPLAAHEPAAAPATAAASAPQPAVAEPPPTPPRAAAAPSQRPPPASTPSGQSEARPFGMAPKPVQAGEFVIQLGAFADPARARALEQRLRKAGFPAYLERVPQANRTRVRAGPYASREAAQKAFESMKKRQLTVGGAEGQIVPKGQ